MHKLHTLKKLFKLEMSATKIAKMTSTRKHRNQKYAIQSIESSFVTMVDYCGVWTESNGVKEYFLGAFLLSPRKILKCA